MAARSSSSATSRCKGPLTTDRPEVYFGEQADHYIIVDGNEPEFTPASGDENVQTKFEGSGGIEIDSLLRKIVYAWKFGDRNILISGALNDNSRLIYRRNIQQRIHEIAPFLRLDADPVRRRRRRATCTGCRTPTRRPTCIPYSHRTGGVNYIRNSVKVVVNAYSGETNFYATQPDEPLLKAYAAIFPDLFKPLDEMPATLQAAHPLPGGSVPPPDAGLPALPHPATRAQFYQKEDQWDIPTEIFGSTEQAVRPYYVIARMPGETSEEFMLILPFVPLNRTNAIAWLAARSDGENYGKLVSFRFPSSVSVPGPTQVERRIDSDGRVSQQLTLWNQSGSTRHPRQPADDPDRQRQPVLRAALPLGLVGRRQRAAAAQARRRRQRRQHRHGADARPRDRRDLRPRRAVRARQHAAQASRSPTATPVAGATSQPATPQRHAASDAGVAPRRRRPQRRCRDARRAARRSRTRARTRCSATATSPATAPNSTARSNSSTACSSSSARQSRSRRHLALVPYRAFCQHIGPQQV